MIIWPLLLLFISFLFHLLLFFILFFCRQLSIVSIINNQIYSTLWRSIILFISFLLLLLLQLLLLLLSNELLLILRILLKKNSHFIFICKWSLLCSLFLFGRSFRRLSFLLFQLLGTIMLLNIFLFLLLLLLHLLLL